MADPRYIKRTMIISPSDATQKYLRTMTLTNFKTDFQSCNWPVEIQSFESIGQTYDLYSQIGKGGEILVLFDDLLSQSGKSLKALLYAAEKNCDGLGVPFLVYQKNLGNWHDLIWFVKKEGGREHEYTGIYESSRDLLSPPFREKVLGCLRNERLFEILKIPKGR